MYIHHIGVIGDVRVIWSRICTYVYPQFEIEVHMYDAIKSYLGFTGPKEDNF